jgi:hypothetical protein
MKNALKAGADWIKNNVFTPVGNWASSMKDKLSGIWTSIKNGFSSLVDKLESGADKIADVFSGVWSAIKGAYNALANGWNRIDIEIGPFSIPDWVPGIGGASFHISDIIPDIPHLATGGYLTGDPLIQAHADEMVLPLSHANGINALADAMALAAQQGGSGLGVPEVRVYIGDRELTDLIDVRVETNNAALAHRARAGTGRH